jgi:hypothetical protein
MTSKNKNKTWPLANKFNFPQRIKFESLCHVKEKDWGEQEQKGND